MKPTHDMVQEALDRCERRQLFYDSKLEDLPIKAYLTPTTRLFEASITIKFGDEFDEGVIGGWDRETRAKMIFELEKLLLKVKEVHSEASKEDEATQTERRCEWDEIYAEAQRKRESAS